MDNTTDPNSTNTPSVPPSGPASPPPSETPLTNGTPSPAMPNPGWTPPPPQPVSSNPLPTTPPEPPATTSPWAPASAAPDPLTTPSSPTPAAPPPQPFDINSLMGSPSSTTPPPTDSAQTPAWTASAPTPTETTIPASSTFPPASSVEATNPAPSPLDNPWGAPPQVPPLGGTEPVPAPEANATSPSTPAWSPSSNSGNSIPTDLSQLIANNNSQPEAAAQPQPTANPETLMVSQANTVPPEVPTVPTEGRKGIPKWLLGVGIGLLLVVIGASAYFILGIGQAPKTTTSVPAVTQPTVKTPPPVATPSPQATPSSETPASGSASFGQIGGTGSQTPQASSAADIIKQRQQTGR